MRKEWNLQTTLLLAFMAIGTVTGQRPPPTLNYILTAYPLSPVDGESMTFSCTDIFGFDIIGAVWFRSGGEIFQTNSDRRTLIITTSNTTIYRDVEDRISVSTSTKQHNVTLKVKASIDNGTVWRCQSAGQDSNNITIFVADNKGTKGTDQSIPSTGPSVGNSTSSSTNNPSTSPRNNGEDLSPGFFENTNNIYIIAGAVGGAVLVILIIVAIYSCGQEMEK